MCRWMTPLIQSRRLTRRHPGFVMQIKKIES